MDTILLIAALLSGGLTIIFILSGLRKVATKSSGRRRRDFLIALGFSLITGVLTVLQLWSTLQQLSSLP